MRYVRERLWLKGCFRYANGDGICSERASLHEMK